MLAVEYCTVSMLQLFAFKICLLPDVQGNCQHKYHKHFPLILILTKTVFCFLRDKINIKNRKMNTDIRLNKALTTSPGCPTAVSYTHLTLPTILRV